MPPARLTTWICMLPAALVPLTAPAFSQAPNGPRHHVSPPESSTSSGSWIRFADFNQTRHWAAMPSWSQPEFAGGPDPDALSLLHPHPYPTDGTGKDPLFGDPLSWPLRPIRNGIDRLAKMDIQLNIYDVLIYQNVSRTIDGAKRNSVFNRFNVEAHVRTWDLPDHGNGIFTIQVRANNNVLNTATPGDAAGTFSPLDDLASNTSFLLNRLEFQQQFFDKRVNLTIGNANPNDVIASNLFAWDETHQFMAVTFDGGNYPSGYSGYLPMVALQVTPVDGIYFSGALTSGIGANYQVFSTLNDGLYWCAGEVGTVVEIGPNKLQGRYSISFMNSNTGPDSYNRDTRTNGNAMAIVLQQEICENYVAWSQYLLSSKNIGPAEQEFTLGLSIENCFDRRNDGFGIAVGWSQPSERYYPGWRQNLQMETYYRLQLTHTWQLTPDFQIARPSNPQAEDAAVFSFALRLMTTF